MNLVFALFVLFSANTVYGANILGLMPVASPSHHIWNSVLMTRLAELGHNVTVLSADIPKPNEKLPPSLHYIHLEEAYSLYKGDTKFDINEIIGVNKFEGIKSFNDFKVIWEKFMLKSKGILTLLNYPDSFKFDLVIYDYTMGCTLLGFVHKFKYPPLIGMSAFHNPPNTLDLMSNHYFPAYIPFYSTTFKTEMNFWERLENTLLFAFDLAHRRLVITPQFDAMARSLFSEDMPYLGDLAKRTAIALVNSHPATNYVDPLPPNVIEVGGMQILDPRPLPKDQDEFMNKSKNGAVFISFGTNMKPQDFSEEQIRTIVGAMAALPQYNFMWKFDVKYLKEKLPKNVLVRTFFSQRDVLAHPNLKAFVTHCGGLSSHEATWRGVPMVGVPLFGDQHRNLRQSIDFGIAVKLDFLTMTTKDLVDAITKVIENPEMRRNAKVKSAQYSDRPVRPLDTAVWWVEYMLRNPNPYHLRSPAHKLNFFQSNSLDCVLFIFVAILLVVYLTAKIVLFALRKLIGNKTIRSDSKKVKKS